MIAITKKLVSDDQTWNVINADVFENPKI